LKELKRIRPIEKWKRIISEKKGKESKRIKESAEKERAEKRRDQRDRGFGTIKNQFSPSALKIQKLKGG